MSDAAIWTALSEHMESFEGVAGSRMRFPGVDFSRPQSGMWLEIDHFPAEPARPHFADGSSRRHTGYLQVSVCARRGRGLAELTVLADQIAGHFAEGQKMSSGGITVRVIRKPVMLSPIEDDGIVMAAVPVRYEAII